MTRSTGTTTWLDLSAQDVSAVMPFYSGLFGWEVEGLGEEFGGIGSSATTGSSSAARCPWRG